MRSLWLALAVTVGVFVIQPQATAVTTPQAPQALVVDVLSFTDFGSGQWESRVNVSFEGSPDDPSPSTTSGYNYSISFDLPSICSRPEGASCSASFNGTSRTPIPNREGWFWATNFPSPVISCDANCSLTRDRNVTFNVTAWNGTTPSVGCSLTVDFGDLSPLVNNPGNTFAQETVQPFLMDSGSGYHSCGQTAQIVSSGGVAALVESAYNSDPHFGSVTNVTWLLSPDDPNGTRGEYDYYLFHRYTDPVSSNPACSCHRGLRDMPNASDPAGLRVANVSGFDQPGTFNNLWIEVVARDNLTHQQSVKSCVVVVSEGVRFSGASCGGLTSPSGSFDSSAPAFPFIDVGTMAPAWGLSVTSFALILAGMFTLACALAGFFYAGRVGAVCMSILSLAVDALWNLLPLWVLVLIFLAGVSFIVLSFSGGKTE